MVERMDQGIGKIVSALAQQKALDNTLVMYMQDNGGCAEPLGRNLTKDRPDGPRLNTPSLPPVPAAALPAAMIPPQTRDGFPIRQGPNVVPGPADTYVAYGKGWATVSNTPFREYKHWVHEGGISTPLIVHWPKGISDRHALRHDPGHLIDVMATCVDVSGAAYPAEATRWKANRSSPHSQASQSNARPLLGTRRPSRDSRG